MSAALNQTNEAGIRKAAILVASLDEPAAELLLAQLGPERGGRVREAVAALPEIDADEQQRVIDEFFRLGPMLPSQSPPGIELDGISRDSYGDCLERAPEKAPPFGFLCEAEDENLAQLLAGERPQTIALVLSHLPAERAGQLLARLAPSLQVEVVRRLADLENTDPEVLCEIQRALEARWSRQFVVERSHAAGPEAVARILAAADRQVAAHILDNLVTHDRPLAEQLGCRPLAFDDLAEIDNAALVAAFRTAEPEVAEMALLGAPPELLERLLQQMDPAEARRLRRSLGHPGPIRLSDVEEARRQMAALVQQMSFCEPQRTVLVA